ncbi:uncharacterized protein LOC132940692 [Metopolophium dirhodum]|uniref:uncharacterized protein LOC132940692 n=1 Tax=Metopolophium dirhodum TaxID=44670 RepID=UPI00298F4C63|nr:uncharacterized protein LOC132940692 [Metopolophium dirhodum]
MCVTCKEKKKENRNISGAINFTSNFRLHMKRLHMSELEACDAYLKVGGPKRASTSNDNSQIPTRQRKLTEYKSTADHKQKKLDENIMRYIILGMKPLSTVKDEHFIKIFKDLDCDLTIYSRRTLSHRIDGDYKKINGAIKNLFEMKQLLVTTTADIWSTKHHSFMGVTAHWIDSITLERQSCVLACNRFTGKHSYDRVTEMLYNILGEFSLRRVQVVSTITDNGSNFVKAFKEFGCENNDVQCLQFRPIVPDNNANEGDQIMLLPHHLRCASHTLSLIATSDFMKAIKSIPVNRLHLTAIEKCNFLWNMSRRPKSAEVIKNLDIEYLDEFVILLKPIACALDYLQGQINFYYGVLLPTLFSLKHRLESLKEKQLRLLSSMIAPLILSLSNRFDSFLNLKPEANTILAICFHTTFKLLQNKVVQKLNLIQVQSQSQNLLLFFLLNQTSSDNSQVVCFSAHKYFIVDSSTDYWSLEPLSVNIKILCAVCLSFNGIYGSAWITLGLSPYHSELSQFEYHRDLSQLKVINNDGIHIFVDMSYIYMVIQRVPKLKYLLRPAPIQVSWLGYLNTSCATWMDYLITDKICSSPEPVHTNQIIFVGDITNRSFLIYVDTLSVITKVANWEAVTHDTHSFSIN